MTEFASWRIRPKFDFWSLSENDVSTPIERDPHKPGSDRSILSGTIAAIDRRRDRILSRDVIRLAESIHALYLGNEGILLTGSHVGDRADEFSDYDFLVLDGDEVMCSNWHNDMRYINSVRCDIHVGNVKYFESCFLRDRHTYTCFFLKMFSEGIILCDGSELRRLRNKARQMYLSPRPYADWGTLVLTLSSRLSSFYREKDFSQRILYYSELLTYVIRICAMAFVGWFARMDVMSRWVYLSSRETFEFVESCFEDAINGSPDDLYELCRQMARTMLEEQESQGGFSISEKGFARL